MLVVFRGRAVGTTTMELESLVGADRIVWFTARPRAVDVVRAERIATTL